jgi:hypothetical protein
MKNLKSYSEHNNLTDNNENVDYDIIGMHNSKIATAQTRRRQYLYNYHTGEKISADSKYELSRRIFDLAKRSDEIGDLAKYCLQIEKDSIAGDSISVTSPYRDSLD